jgi:hypothetical protein
MPQPAVVFPQLKPTVRSPPPFDETKEALGGYLVFEADHLDAAIELASQIPAARMGPDRGAVARRQFRGRRERIGPGSQTHAQVQLEPDGAATT